DAQAPPRPRPDAEPDGAAQRDQPRRRHHPRRTRAPVARAGAVAHRQHQRTAQPRPDRAPPRQNGSAQAAHRTHQGWHRAAGGRPGRTGCVAVRDHARQLDTVGVRSADARRRCAPQAGLRRGQSGHTGRMTSSRTSTAAQEWISHDPDPQTAAELASLSEEELDERFARPLMFGTAGLRGPLRGGPNGMNLAVVLRTTWAVAKVLTDHGLAGKHVVIGRDTRHGSEEFALAAAEVLAAQGFATTLMFAAVPTPVVAFAVRHLPAVAGIQITASHNPPSDNGYKVYFEGGFPIVPPIDEEIERAAAQAPHADQIPRRPVKPSRVEIVQHSVERATQVRHTHGSLRVALTPMHGVGGEFAMDALVAAGIDDVHVVESQFAPDPDFPTVSLPNPEEPGAVDALLKLAADVDAEIA